MHEDLLNAVSNLVHRHVLRELHNMTGAMLARLDDGANPTRNNSAPPPAEKEIGAAPTLATVALSVKPGTVARRERKRRARLRQANGQAKAPPIENRPDPLPNDWPALRQAIRAHIADRGISHERAAAEIGEVKRGTFSTWLSRDVPAPSERSVSRMRRWLREIPANAVDADPIEPPPVYTLSEPEQVTLRGHLSLGVDRDLRQQFGVARGVLEACADGQHMAPEAIERVRKTLLSDGGAAE